MVKFEAKYPCGYEIKINSFFGLYGNLLEECPIHGKDCKK